MVIAAKKAGDANPMDGPWFDPLGRPPRRPSAAAPAVEVIEQSDGRVLIRTDNRT
ncbi:MAG: hypothetical protein ACRENJ_09920 [Candidatus Eiseniibacteriota bacterium]